MVLHAVGCSQKLKKKIERERERRLKIIKKRKDINRQEFKNKVALKHRIGACAHTHTHPHTPIPSVKKIPTSIALPIIVCS